MAEPTQTTATDAPPGRAAGAARIAALATDYDGTLATHGAVPAATVAALQRLRASGRKLVMVTGRQLPDLKQVFGHLDLFDAVVAENGALVYWPDRDAEELLGAPPSPAFIAALRTRGVAPLFVGQVIVAALEPQAPVMLQAILDTGSDRELILNKDSVMCLPVGVDKASGLLVALKRLDVPPEHAVGVGDAENDLALITACGIGVAVANALPSLKAAADLVTEGEEGAGVAWLIDRILDDPGAFAADAGVRGSVLGAGRRAPTSAA